MKAVTMSASQRMAAVSLAMIIFVLGVAFVPLAAEANAGFYLPGISPRQYLPGDEIIANVNSLRSLTQLVPFDYYKGPFCKPKNIASNAQSLGEIITGDHVESSLYSVKMLENSSCTLLKCAQGEDGDLVRKNLAQFKDLIDKGYRGHMNIDNLPVFNPGVPILDGRCKGEVPLSHLYPFQRGYALGVNEKCIGSTLINNHIALTIKYHAVTVDGKNMFRIVGLNGVPYSVRHAADGSDCNSMFSPNAQDVKYLSIDDMKAPDQKVWWSYSVNWVEAPTVTWATRWDEYFNTSVADANATVHWVYIITSLIITICLTAIVTINLMRALHKDFNRYNSPNPDDQQEEVGWKLVHADVFRPPENAKFFAAIIGNGVQVTLVVCSVLFFSLLGLLSPASRGMLLTAFLLMYVLMAVAGGYVCGRLLQMFDQKEWRAVFVCGNLLPGTIFIFYLFTDILNSSAGASDAIPFSKLLTLFVLWVGINIPLTVVGASFAFRQPPVEPAVKIGRLAREIPVQRLHHAAPFIYLIPPMAPLAAAFLELRFIFASFWQGMVYYVFGFFAIVFVVWALTAALTTLLVLYNMLCYENHRWWWASLVIPGGFGLHLVVYSAYYYATQTNISGATGTIIYFLFMSLLALAYGLISGTIGFFASLLFTRKIYTSIKID